MLWYKAWLESRVRFLLSATTIGGICLLVVLFQKGNRADAAETISYSRYIWEGIYKAYGRDLFVFLIVFLGLGGLSRERANGTAGFTLALPVSRSLLVAVRAVVGLLETAVLAMLPAVLIPTFSPLVQESYGFSQALRFALLWMCCGAVVFAMSFLLSAALSSEYSPPAVALIVLGLYASLLNLPILRSFASLNLFSVMNGEALADFQPGSGLLTGPMPWAALSADAISAFVLIAIASWATQRQDF